MHHPCSIELFGGLQVRQGERVIARFRTQKTAALLAYLACFLNRAHPREELVELLWPETDPEDGRASLRTALSSLRRQLEPPGIPPDSVLLADRANVRLNPAAVTTDAAAFEAAVQASARAEDDSARAEALRRAVQLYRGPLLPGFYDEWALLERERLERMYVEALGRLGALLEATGELGPAIECAHRRLRSDPLSEEAHCALLRLYLAAGQPEVARDHYREMERLFREELGASPPPVARDIAARLPAEGPPKRRRVAEAGPTAPTPPPASIPPLPAPVQSPRLPLQLTPFFGREDEIARLREWLGGSPGGAARRLVTLTGPGGSGKTRLAVEAARGLGDAFDGRVWFVPLADLADAGLVPDAVLSALALTRASGGDALEQIAEALAGQPCLLVLDNFEHLVEGGAETVLALLERSSGLSCLVTSRQRLELPGEREFPVPPLAVPPTPGTPEQLVAFPSVRLFVDRAQAARADFQVTRENAQAVAALCERLEGIPLAIELAAAWAGVLTPGQMLARMEERLAFLASRRRGLPDRQRSLREAIDWSYRLLTPEQQNFFACLSVFRGGWSLEAAEAVCAAPDALELLHQLRERSLILAEESGGQMRFRMLETLREFAGERLAERGEAPAARRRHLEYYLALAEAVGPRTRGPDQGAALALLESEHDNLRAALDESLCGEAPFSPAAGLRLAAALAPFWDTRGYLDEGRKRLEALLTAGEEAADGVRARAHGAAGTLAWQLGGYAAARAHFETSLALSRAEGDRQAAADALHGLGVVSEEQAEYEAARVFLQESLTIKRELGDRRGLASSLNVLANALTGRGEYAEGKRLYEESRELMRDLGDLKGVSTSLNNLAIMAYEQGNYGESRALLEECLAVRREMGDPRGIAICLNNLAELAWAGGEMASARALNEEALAIRRELGDCGGIASSLMNLANVAASQGDHASARALYAESLEMRRKLEDRLGTAACLEKLALVAAADGQAGRAVRLFGAAERLREQIQAPIPPAERAAYEDQVKALRDRLPTVRFEQAWQAGRDLSPEEAVALAHEWPAEHAEGRGREANRIVDKMDTT